MDFKEQINSARIESQRLKDEQEKEELEKENEQCNFMLNEATIAISRKIKDSILSHFSKLPISEETTTYESYVILGTHDDELHKLIIRNETKKAGIFSSHSYVVYYYLTELGEEIFEEVKQTLSQDGIEAKGFGIEPADYYNLQFDSDGYRDYKDSLVGNKHIFNVTNNGFFLNDKPKVKTLLTKKEQSLKVSSGIYSSVLLIHFKFNN